MRARSQRARSTGRLFERRRKLPRCPKLTGPTPEARLQELEDHARSTSRTFGRDLDFDAPRWRITPFMALRGGVPSRKGEMHLAFTRTPDAVGAAAPMGRAMAGFARSYLRNCRGLGYDALHKRLNALRIIEEAMDAAAIPSVCDLTTGVLNAAVDIAETRYAANSAAAIAYQMESVARYLAKKRIAAPSLAGWRHRVTSAQPSPDKSSEEAQDRREEKLPSARALAAITAAYPLARHACDVIVVCLAAVAGAVPGRVNEQLALAEDCEVKLVGNDGAIITGVRWPGSKRFGDHVKLSGSAMAPVVRHALARLREVTEDGRRIKRWYDTNKGELHLPGRLEHLRGKERLTPDELGTLLGMAVTPNLDNYVRRNALADLPKDAPKCRSSKRVSFRSVEAHLLALLPRIMADAGGIECHPLLVVPWGLFRRRLGTDASPCMFQMVGYHHVWKGLKPRRGASSVFQRLGLDPDGTISLLHHQLRHWLNTLCQEGEMSQLDIALWSGRGKVGHNSAYDHTTHERTMEILRRVRRRGGRP